MSRMLFRMTDRDRHQLRGPVQSVRVEFGSIDPRTSDWEPLKEGPDLIFDREGREARRPQDDAPATSTVDERGLRTTVGLRPPFVPRQAGLEYGISLDVTVRFDVLTHYDAQSRPAEIVYRDPQQAVLH